MAVVPVGTTATVWTTVVTVAAPTWPAVDRTSPAATLQNGDVLVAYAHYNATEAAAGVTAPAGWSTSLAPNVNGAAGLAVFHKRITDIGTEPTTYTFTPSASARGNVAMRAYRGVDATTTWDAGPTASGTGNTTANVAFNVTGVTTSTANAFIVASAAIGASTTGTWQTVPGATTIADLNGRKSYTVEEGEQAVAGATGNLAFTTDQGAVPWRGMQGALKPSAGDPDPGYGYLKINATDKLLLTGTTGALLLDTNQAPPVAATGTASLSLSASGAAADGTQPATGTASLSLSAAGNAGSGTAAATGSGSITLSATGTAGVPSTETVVNLWVGAVTSTGATVSVKTTGGSQATLAVSTASNLSSPSYGSPATINVRDYAKPTITGLSANTQYYYGISIDGALDVVTTGSFRTAPSGATSFDFGFSACNTTGNNSDAFNRILARDPDLFFICGDLHYNDPGNATAFYTGYDTQLATDMGTLTADVPMYYTWSDHDWSSDNNGSASSAMNATANSIYRERVPHHTLPGGSSGIYQTFVWGRVRFIITDERTFKSANSATDNSSKTMLGTTQKQWLKDNITDATEPVIFWVGDTPWNGAAASPDDEWFAYNTERQELATFFAASGKNIIRLSGDMHAVAADDGTNSPGGIPILHAAPLYNTFSVKGGPYTSGPYPTSGSSQLRQYGFVTITDTGTAVTVDYKGYDTADTQRATWSDTYSTDVSATGTASISLSGSGGARAAVSGAGSISLSGSGATQGAATTSASLSLSGAGSARASAAGTGALSLAANATPPSGGNSGAASLTLVAAGNAVSTIAGSGTLTLTAVGTAPTGGGVSATGSLTLSGTGAARGVAVGSGALTLFSVGSAVNLTAGTGTLTLSASGAAVATSSSSVGSITLSGSGIASTTAVAAAVLVLSANGVANGGGSAAASLILSGSTSGFNASVQAGSAALLLSATGATRGVSSGTGSLILSGSATGIVTASSGNGSLSLSGSGVIRAATIGSGNLTLSAAGTSGASSSAGAGSIGLSATGQAVPQGSVIGNALLSITAGGSVTSGGTSGASGSLTLLGSGGTNARATGNAAISLTGSGAGRVTAAGSSLISMTATGSNAGRSGGTGSISLLGAGSPSTQAAAIGAALLTVNAMSAAYAQIAASGVISISASSTTSGAVDGDGALSLMATAGNNAVAGSTAGSALLTLQAIGQTGVRVDITVIIGSTRVVGLSEGLSVGVTRGAAEIVGVTRSGTANVDDTRNDTVVVGNNTSNVVVGITRRDRTP